MSELKYRWILYLIAMVIFATLAIQGYWTYKTYLSDKQQLMNDVQESLDTAVDKYYTLLAQRSTFSHITSGQSEGFNFSFLDSLNGTQRLEMYTFTDSLQQKNGKLKNTFSSVFNFNSGTKNVDTIKKLIADTLYFNKKPFETLTTKVMVSFTQDSLSLTKVDSLLAAELRLKNISLNHELLLKGKMAMSEENQERVASGKMLTARAGSVYIPRGNSLILEYNNITLQVLKKNLFGIFLSLLLLGSVIASLLYLFKIIRNQKKLSEMKNDLISNITHEFKTPLATMGVAMEGITGFSSGKADEKTKRYAQITTEQIKKLNLMVEKLLETATLDSSELILNKESVNLNELLSSCIRNHTVENRKTIFVKLPEETIPYFADAFHLENAINNVIDNALKYGGNRIYISLEKTLADVEISISDSGTGLTEDQKHLIFDKFYRVPKGNIHDVKGFGIGLYYTKKIIEKHGGNIVVELQKDNTIFIIRLPNA